MSRECDRRASGVVYQRPARAPVPARVRARNGRRRHGMCISEGPLAGVLRATPSGKCPLLAAERHMWSGEAAWLGATLMLLDRINPQDSSW